MERGEGFGRRARAECQPGDRIILRFVEGGAFLAAIRELGLVAATATSVTVPALRVRKGRSWGCLSMTLFAPNTLSQLEKSVQIMEKRDC